jgi:adenylylsulfate kinase-like enzyme
MIYWFTGQPAAGKTTLAKLLEKYISNVIHIDGDDIRDIFKNKDYSENGRRINIQKAQDISIFLKSKGFNVIVSLVSPYEDQREKFKNDNDVIEIYVHTDDIRGRENFHVQNYQPPQKKYIDINTTNISELDSLKELLEKIEKY